MERQVILARSGKQVKHAGVFYIESVVNTSHTTLCKLFLTNTARHRVAYASVRPHPRYVYYSPVRIPVRLAQCVKLGMQAHALSVAAFPMCTQLLNDRRGLAAVLAYSNHMTACHEHGCETKLTKSR